MNLNKVLSEAITKGATKVIRKPIAGIRRDVAQLKREIAELKRLIRNAGRRQPSVAAARTTSAASEVPAMRPTAKMIRGLRKKLGVTQAQFAKLAGVSALTVSKWEAARGRIRMRGHTLSGLAAVRAMGKREAKAALSKLES